MGGEKFEVSHHRSFVNHLEVVVVGDEVGDRASGLHDYLLVESRIFRSKKAGRGLFFFPPVVYFPGRVGFDEAALSYNWLERSVGVSVFRLLAAFCFPLSWSAGEGAGGGGNCWTTFLITWRSVVRVRMDDVCFSNVPVGR